MHGVCVYAHVCVCVRESVEVYTHDGCEAGVVGVRMKRIQVFKPTC